MTASLRETTPAAAGASRTTGPYGAAIRRRLGAATVIGLFLSLVGAYRSDAIPWLPRTLLMVTLSILATAMGVVAYAWIGRNRAIAARWPLHGTLAALAMTAPMALLVWTALQLVARRGPPLSSLPAFMPVSFGNALFFCLWAAHAQRARREAGAHAAAAPTPRFLERLPPKLRGAELWAVEAEDHYLRLHTSKGRDLVLMRLSDALAELYGLDGAQTHRSWWVARGAIREVRRSDGRATLTLPDGTAAPVSRTHARALRARGWL